jgi:signal transduction histidine kinase
MNGRGTIRLKTWPGEDRQKVFISVSDTGPGVPPHIAELIFDPFFTTKEQGKGTGLGLSVAYGVVERHKGRIRLTQSEEPGACFEIELPALPVDDASHASGKSKLRGDIVIGG